MVAERTCGKCGGVAVLQRETPRRLNGLPTGIEYQFRCAQCGVEFTTDAPWGLAVMAVLAVGLAGAALVVYRVLEDPLGWHIWSKFLAVLSFGVVAGIVKRLTNAARNPARADVAQRDR